VELSLCWGQMARGRDGERRQRETLLQLDRLQEGKSEARKWSRNGPRLPARGAAREPPTALGSSLQPGHCRGFHEASVCGCLGGGSEMEAGL